MNSFSKNLLSIIFSIFLILGIVLYKKLSTSNNMQNFNYFNLMRDFVNNIKKTAIKKNKNFYIIGQNALELITIDGNPKSKIDINYLKHLDGIGIEELFYGYDKQGVKTPYKITKYYLRFLLKSKKYLKKILVIDYVNNKNQAQISNNNAQKYGFVAFQTNRKTTIIPKWQVKFNRQPINNLSEVKNFLYILNPENFDNKTEFINSLAQTWYDLIIIDAFFNNEQLNQNDIDILKSKPNGASRLVIAYMSIGEAEDYRYYWDSEWYYNPPEFLEKENPDWPGNYKVKYWNEDWQKIIYKNENFDNTYLGKIINAGFDGAYLDILDAAIYFTKN